jgi:hypothetical protein
MKKILTLTILAASMTALSFAQPAERKYGVELNQFALGSGFGTSSELRINVTDEKGRTLGLGVFYDYRYNNIGGISAGFSKTLRPVSRRKQHVLEPYCFYNFIYRKTIITESRISETYTVNIGTYKSMEHHIGLGLKTNVSQRFFINAEAGYGIYLGSIMRPSVPDAFMTESYGTNGAGFLVKAGIGFTF